MFQENKIYLVVFKWPSDSRHFLFLILCKELLCVFYRFFIFSRKIFSPFFSFPCCTQFFILRNLPSNKNLSIVFGSWSQNLQARCFGCTVFGGLVSEPPGKVLRLHRMWLEFITHWIGIYIIPWMVFPRRHASHPEKLNDQQRQESLIWICVCLFWLYLKDWLINSIVTIFN